MSRRFLEDSFGTNYYWISIYIRTKMALEDLQEKVPVVKLSFGKEAELSKSLRCVG